MVVAALSTVIDVQLARKGCRKRQKQPVFGLF
jgi:hypothetical protein